MEDMRMMSSAEMRKLEKQSKNPSRPEDTPTLPENFSWANTNRTKCRIDTIRDQSNCGSCWVILFIKNDNESILIIQIQYAIIFANRIL